MTACQEQPSGSQCCQTCLHAKSNHQGTTHNLVPSDSKVPSDAPAVHQGNMQKGSFQARPLDPHGMSGHTCLVTCPLAGVQVRQVSNNECCQTCLHAKNDHQVASAARHACMPRATTKEPLTTWCQLTARCKAMLLQCIKATCREVLFR